MEKDLYLTEAMKLYKKKFKNNSLNIINSHAGSGKTNFIFNEFLNNTCNYVNCIKESYINDLGSILYICDTVMLKESVLNDNKDITKVLEKNDLKRVMDSNDLQKNNKIIVITYNSLGFLLKNESNRYIINKYFKCIIMDEIHNLFKYHYRYKEKENTFYNDLINNLNTLIRNKNIIIIGMTATPFNMYYSMEQCGICAWNTMFNYHELKTIKRYKAEDHIFCKYPINIIKWFAIESEQFKKTFNKGLIYTNTISIAKKYKQILIDGGLKAEYLCSLNSNKMNDTQKMIRKFVIENKRLPDNIDILIINGAYETGWNLENDTNEIQFIMIDTSYYNTQVQARNRVRHDISLLYTKEIVDKDGIPYEKDKYKNLQLFDEYKIYNPVVEEFIDKSYINKKLTKEDKQYLVSTYGSIPYNKSKATWQTFKRNINENTVFKVVTGRKGTYIIDKNDTLKDILKRGNKMNNDSELIKYLKSIETIPLDKDMRIELINKINCKVDGHLQKSNKKLNSYFVLNDIPFKIDSKRLTINNKQSTYWIVEKI